MAAIGITNWVPIEKSLGVEGRELQQSAIAKAAMRRRSYRGVQVDVPRLTNATVGGGSTLTADTSTTDVVSMYDYLYNGLGTFDEAQVEDSRNDAIDAWVQEWYNSNNIAYDNASIGVTGTRSATASAYRPYTSIYKAIRTDDNSGAVSYTADTNLTQTGTGGLTYANLVSSLGKVQSTQFWLPSTGALLIHPGLQDEILSLLDNDGRPIFVESSNGGAGGTAHAPGLPGSNGRAGTIFGYPVYWTHGAITSPDFRTQTGNKLAVWVNRNRLVYGVNVEPESRFIPARINPSALEHNVQARARRGFVLTVPNAASVLEVNKAGA